MTININYEENNSYTIKFVIKISREVLNQLIRLPDKPGVYLFKDEENNIIFVNRVKSISKHARAHFHSNKRIDLLIKSKTRSVEFFAENDEMVATKKELELIRKYHPPLNQRGHDQKRYRFIELTMDHQYPSATLRKIMSEKETIKIIGPFPKKSTIRQVFNFAVNRFEIADCRQRIITGRKNKTVATCLRRKTQQCCRPCERPIDEKEYSDKIANFIRFFNGETPEILEELEQEMKKSGENFEFEKAALLRDQITAIKQHIKF